MDLILLFYALVAMFWAMILTGFTALGIIIYGIVAEWREEKVRGKHQDQRLS